MGRLNPQFLPADDFPEPHMEDKPKQWSDMTRDERSRTLVLMRIHGGSFARELAHAWIRADPINSDKLAAAFPELVQRYYQGGIPA